MMSTSEKFSRDRRLDSRLRIHQGVRIIFLSGEDEKSYEATVEEVNDSGMSLSLPLPVALPPRIKIELSLNSGSETFILPSIVRWSSSHYSQFRVGVSFRHLNFNQTKLLNRFLKESNAKILQQSNRRKEDRRGEVRELRRSAESNTQIVHDLRKKLRTRVAITGIGVISPMGIGSDVLWEKISKGQSAIDVIEIESRDGKKLKVLAAKCSGFNPAEFLDLRQVRKLQRSTQFACAAASLAIQDAGIKPHTQQNASIGVFVGTIMGGLEKVFEQSMVCLERGMDAMDPMIGITGSWDEAASQISMQLHLNGPSHTICTGCASSTDAIGMGFRAIQRGELDIALVGGTDAPISPQIISSYLNLGLLSNDINAPKESMRPFDKRRNGFVLGEGATFLILENLDKAQLRGANISAELAGYGNSCDAYSPTSRDPLGNGLAVAISNAIRDAEIQPANIDYINLHGTATIDGDRSEALAIKKVFGQYVSRISFGITKPFIGHMQGACGSTEAAIAIMAMKNNDPPRLLNLDDPDPECQLNFVKQGLRSEPIEMAMSINSGFGGKNAVLVYRSFKGF